ncbi:gastrula zinc finger protein XlCGF57.1-like isoform X3 [Pseudoliparis swirei]|uniref:gastrula zinc finger protein XlCGF57.1-like isoform X3 n=1 Tax=Pseudoliparis swirei TaxID=2059687 RepID=UPI0024BECA68|nr:gastrula zinc finger protein XlCGF57.1-like isoform X3 [Pseudoliparis swirei]XP_056261946.1 gastrula zinc finger protein XlCGF57.1-like isoform X3 [Pseudoliparis swirei]
MLVKPYYGQQVIGGEEEQQDWSSSLNREDPEPPHIKEEQEDPESPHIEEVNEDPEPPHIKEEQEELWTNQEGQQLQGLEEAGIGFIFTIAKSEDEEGEVEAQSSHLHQRLTEHNEPEDDREDYRGPEPDRKSGPGDSSETEVSDHWKETRDPPSGLSSLNNYFSSEKPFRCSVCRKGFGLKGTLKEHMRFHTGEKPFSCSVCKKSFAWRGSLHKHTRIHTREQRFSCSVCQSRFTWFHQLKTHTCVGHQSSQLLYTQENREAEPPAGSSTGHMETEEDGEDCGGPEPDRNSDPDRRLDPETDNSDDWKETREPPSGLNSLNYDDVSLEKPFSCSECEKAFNDRGNLRNHMRIHTGEKPFSCSECEKRFRFNGDLKRHTRTHSGEKPFSCSTCGKKFGNSGHLNRHMRIHTGEKPFSCSFCEHRFLQRAHLDAHIRSHTGEKPFSCSFCEKLFSQRGTLRLHMRIHTGEKPFSCSL